MGSVDPEVADVPTMASVRLMNGRYLGTSGEAPAPVLHLAEHITVGVHGLHVRLDGRHRVFYPYHRIDSVTYTRKPVADWGKGEAA